MRRTANSGFVSRERLACMILRANGELAQESPIQGNLRRQPPAAKLRHHAQQTFRAYPQGRAYGKKRSS